MKKLFENWRKTLKEFGAEDLFGADASPAPEPQTGERELADLDAGDKFTIGNRKPVYRIWGQPGKYYGSIQKVAVIDGTAERKLYVIMPVGNDSYEVGAFEMQGGRIDQYADVPRGKPGLVNVVEKGSATLEREKKGMFEGWREFLEEDGYGQIKGTKYVLDLKNMSIMPTKHGEERRLRHKKDGRGMTISKDSITKGIEAALGEVMNDFMNGELENNEPFLIRAQQGTQPTLNIVCALKMGEGPDAVNIITVMRKDDFKTDNFQGGAQKEYSVNI